MITKNIRLDLSLFPDPTLAERKWGVVIIRHPTWPLRGITKHHIRNHVLIMPYTVYYLCHVELHCGAYYSNNCAVIGHFTCQTAVTELGRTSYVTRSFSSPGGWGLDMRLLTEGWEMVWLDRLIRGFHLYETLQGRQDKPQYYRDMEPKIPVIEVTWLLQSNWLVCNSVVFVPSFLSLLVLSLIKTYSFVIA